MAAAAFILSYLLGSIPTAYLLVKWIAKVDVRTIGSGNVGATNAGRAAGKKVSMAVFIIDLLKGLVAATVVAAWLLPEGGRVGAIGCGLLSILGHNFPIFLGFKGGKGVATTIGVLFGAMPWVGLVCVLGWAVLFFVSRYVSVASLGAAVMIPVGQVLMHFELNEVLLGAALALLIVIRHHANIRRLVRGEELRAGSSKAR